MGKVYTLISGTFTLDIHQLFDSTSYGARPKAGPVLALHLAANLPIGVFQALHRSSYHLGGLPFTHQPPQRLARSVRTSFFGFRRFGVYMLYTKQTAMAVLIIPRGINSSNFEYTA